ncbi:MAG: LLM class F420-dependent oxidoreductase [Candidatus Microthrix parvicella]|jgi:F420-dependent oxidoreductase-like protein
MKLSMTLNYSGDPRAAAAEAADLERAGIDVGWVAELYSFDAVSILGYLAAKTETMELGSSILPIYSRTPTLTAMTAAGLDAVSEGRFILGIGASGPQVIEGWHGVPYDRPIGRQRELIDICRKVWRREVVTHDGPSYHLPLPADQGTGLGKPLKLINHPKRADIPVYIASLGPKNVEVTAEIANGWIPVFFHPDKADSVWGDPIAAGLARRDASLPPMEVVAGGALSICDEATAARIRDLGRFMTALYVGGMGAKGKNFYNNIFCAYGYEAEAEQIQDLYLAGRKDEAMAAVPQEFLDATAMVGDEGRVRERIEAYRAAGVTRLQVQPMGDNQLQLIEKVKGWIS